MHKFLPICSALIGCSGASEPSSGAPPSAALAHPAGPQTLANIGVSGEIAVVGDRIFVAASDEQGNGQVWSLAVDGSGLARVGDQDCRSFRAGPSEALCTMGDRVVAFPAHGPSYEVEPDDAFGFYEDDDDTNHGAWWLATASGVAYVGSWNHSSSSGVYRLDRSGDRISGATRVAADGEIHGIAADATGLFALALARVSETSDSEHIVNIDLLAQSESPYEQGITTVTRTGSTDELSFDLAVTDTHFLWSADDASQIRCMKRNGGTAVSIANATAVAHIERDGATVYWASYGDGLYRAASDCTNVEKLVDGAVSFSITADYVYYSSSDSTVGRIAK
jgi:hypothetical protein